MGKRVLSGVVLVVLMAAILVFNTSFPLVINLTTALISVIAIYEVAMAVGLAKKIWFLFPGLFFAAATPFLIGTEWLGLAIFLYTVLLFSAQLWYHTVHSFREVGLLYSLTLIICMALGTVVLIRDQNGQYGLFYVVLSIMTAWVSDVGAIFFGKLMGKHKLCPLISPKKTVEGLVGGFVFEFIFVALAGFVGQAVYNQPISWLSLILIGILGSAISVLGDLSFSVVKRGCQIKDFGNLIPGHGGILDRFDGVIFTAPLVYYLVVLLPVFA